MANRSTSGYSYFKTTSGKNNISQHLKICYADALNRLDRLEECTTLLKQCLSGESSDKSIWIRLGLAYSKHQALTAALDAFNRANQIDPNDLEMVANRITILKILDNLKKQKL